MPASELNINSALTIPLCVEYRNKRQTRLIIQFKWEIALSEKHRIVRAHASLAFCTEVHTHCITAHRDASSAHTQFLPLIDTVTQMMIK